MTTRQEIESNVRSVNTVLVEKIPTMSLIELLRNCHPSYRGEWAYRLYKEQKLTKEEAREFVKIL